MFLFPAAAVVVPTVVSASASGCGSVGEDLATVDTRDEIEDVALLVLDIWPRLLLLPMLLLERYVL